jgi:hypothetical protein
MAENDLGLRVIVRNDKTLENVIEVVLAGKDAEGGSRLIERLYAFSADVLQRKRAIEYGRLRAGLSGYEFIVEV